MLASPPIVRLLIFLVLYSTRSASAASPADSWTIYTTENSGLASNFLSMVAADERGAFWTAYRDKPGMITRFDGNAWKTFTAADGLPEGTVTALAAGGGTAWAIVSSLGSRLYRFANGRWETPFFRSSRYFGGKLAVDSGGNLWVTGRLSETGNHTLSRFDGVEWMTWFIGGPGEVMGIGRFGAVWLRVSHSSGRDIVYRYDGSRWFRYDHDRLQEAVAIAEDIDGLAWSAGPMGVSGFDGAAWSNSCSCRFAGQSVAADRYGRVWFTGADALIRYDGGASLPEYISSPQRYDRIVASPDGSLLFFETDNPSGLARYTPAPPLWALRTAAPSAFPFESSALSPGLTENGDNWFPLATGNTWIYRRTLTNHERDTFADRVALTVIDTITIVGAVHYEFLDGRRLRNDGNGRVWSSEYAVYDFRPCGVADCGPEWDPLRWEWTANVPAGTFTGFGFRRNGWFDIMEVDAHTIAPPVGLVAANYGNDQGDSERLSLEYAWVNGREYGIRSAAPSESVPRRFKVCPPSPNPFNPSTTIHFDLSETSAVRLTIYTASGQKVAELGNDVLSPGSHVFSWNAKGCAAGLYLFLIEAGKNRQAGKMMLVR